MRHATPSNQPSPSRRFGRFELQPQARRLLVDDQPVAVGARAFDLLVALAERAGQLVTKHELLERVWPGLVVEENNLQVQVSTLRKLLGPTQSPRSPVAVTASTSRSNVPTSRRRQPRPTRVPHRRSPRSSRPVRREPARTFRCICHRYTGATRIASR